MRSPFWGHICDILQLFYIVTTQSIQCIFYFLLHSKCSVLSCAFKRNTLAFQKGISAFPKSTINPRKRLNHLPTPVCSSFLDVSNQNNFSWILKRQMRATIARKMKLKGLISLLLEWPPAPCFLGLSFKQVSLLHVFHYFDFPFFSILFHSKGIYSKYTRGYVHVWYHNPLPLCLYGDILFF